MSLARSSTAFSKRSLTARTAGEIAQAFDVVFAQVRRPARLQWLESFVTEPAVEHDGEVFNGSDLDDDTSPEDDFSGALSCTVGRIGDSKCCVPACGLIGENRHLPQEPLRKRLVQRRC